MDMSNLLRDDNEDTPFEKLGLTSSSRLSVGPLAVQGNQVTHSQMVKKKSPAIFNPWQERWLELTQNTLRYYILSGSKKDLKGVLNFDLYDCKLEQTSPVEFSLKIEGCDRLFEFKCDSNTSTTMWVNKLNLALQLSKGKIKSYIAPQIKEFWRTD
jgi:hypothetical protein